MKMHKLMYFAQRESLMLSGNVLFQEDFFGWKHGPVLKSVRSEYMKERPFQDVEGRACQATKNLVKAVMDRYADLSSWRLSSLSHDEFSWKCSRKGLDASDDGNVKLETSALKVDAARESSRRKSQLNMPRGVLASMGKEPAQGGNYDDFER